MGPIARGYNDAVPEVAREAIANFFDNLRQRSSKNMPEYDVGDLLTILIKKNGYKTYTCKNSYNTPSLVQSIKEIENYFKEKIGEVG